MLESNELIKRDFNTNRDDIPVEEQKKFNELDEERSYEFQNLKEKSNSNNLIYKYKIQGRGPKDFGNFQNPIDLFRNLRDCNVNPKDVFKTRIDFKSDIEEIKKEIQS